MESSIHVLEQIKTPHLYRQLVQQINKDFERAQYPVDLAWDLLPQQLVTALVQHIAHLVGHNTSLLQQLLYLIDIPEENMLHIAFEDEVKAAHQLTLHILQREWQKVYLRDVYSS